MIFALADYFKYRRRTGRFSRKSEAGLMAGSFEGSISPKALELLQPGDVLFFQTLGNPASWAIMYLTCSQVSHVAFYTGENEITHSVPGGVRTEALDSTYRESVRILPCIWPMDSEKRQQLVEMVNAKYVDRPYGWRSVIRKGLRILSARDWPGFRWKFFIDFTLLVILAYAASSLLGTSTMILGAIPVYLLVILFNMVLWKFKPLKFDESTAKPGDLLVFLEASGGQFIMDTYSLHKNFHPAK